VPTLTVDGESLRIQLEGQLEVVEATVDDTQRALEGLKSDVWRDDLRWRFVRGDDEHLEAALTGVRSRAATDFTLLLELTRLRVELHAMARSRLQAFERQLPGLEATASTRAAEVAAGALAAAGRCSCLCDVRAP